MSDKPTGWKVYRHGQFYATDQEAVNEYVGFVPNDGQTSEPPADVVMLAEQNYADLRRQVDDIYLTGTEH